MASNEIKTPVLILSLAAVVLTEATAAGIISSGFMPPMIVIGLTRLIQATLLIMIVLVWYGNLAPIGLARDQISHGIKKGIIWSTAFGTCVLIIAIILLFTFKINPLTLFRSGLPDQTSARVYYYLAGVFWGPLTEEIFFRGIIYSYLRRWGILTAVTLSTLFFVLSHAVNTTFPVTQILGGILFAVAYEKEKMLMVPVTIHVSGNMAIITLSMLF